jgi:ADP-ribose pyrophosphatase YjhB (NUDIX family)
MNGGIVLVKRDIEPRKGRWVTPGGYVDRGEEVKDAAIRETSEECGILTRVKDLLGVYSYTGRLVVVITFISEYISGDLIAGDEVQDVKLCSASEIPWGDMAFQSTTASLEDYYHLIKGRHISSKVKESQSASHRV